MKTGKNKKLNKMEMKIAEICLRSILWSLTHKEWVGCPIWISSEAFAQEATRGGLMYPMAGKKATPPAYTNLS